MSTLSQNTAVRAGAVAGFLITAAIGWQLAGDAPPAPAIKAADSRTTKVSARQARSNSRYQTPAYAKERLRAIRAAGSTQERMRATIELANTLPVSELESWLEGRWFDDSEGFDLTLFNKIAKERWLKEDPEGLALWSLKSGGQTHGILASWAKDDPQRVIGFFKEHPNEQMELQMLQSIAKSDPALALGRLREIIAGGLGTGNISGYYGQQVLRSLAQSNPAALEAMLDSLPTKWRNTAEGAILTQKLNSSFSEEIQKLWERPDGLKILLQAGGGVEGFNEKLIGELANMPASWKSALAADAYGFLDSSTAEKWLNLNLEGSGFTSEQAKQIRKGAVQNLMYQKPEVALKMMGTMDFSDDERTSMIRNLFSNTRGDTEKAEGLIALLGTEQDRQTARNALATSSSSSQAKNAKPSEWLETASAFDANTGSGYQILSQLRNWDKEKLAELTSQFQTMPDAGKRNVAQVLAGDNNGIDPNLQGEAIRYLVANPIEPKEGQQTRRTENPVRLASDHAVQMVQKDPFAATVWVQTLPSGEAKLWAQKNLAANWVQYDPDAANQWVKSLPADARGEVQNFLKSPPRN